MEQGEGNPSSQLEAIARSRMNESAQEALNASSKMPSKEHQAAVQVQGKQTKYKTPLHEPAPEPKTTNERPDKNTSILL